jgi:hypothetical protein
MQMTVLSSDAEWLLKESTFVIDSARTQKFVDNHNPTITALAITHQATLFRQCLSKERIFWFKNTDLGKDYVGSVSVFFFLEQNWLLYPSASKLEAKAKCLPW